jgi:catechol 2,3-dioxygenase-like lactoylglutathione lyase family enzyme
MEPSGIQDQPEDKNAIRLSSAKSCRGIPDVGNITLSSLARRPDPQKLDLGKHSMKDAAAILLLAAFAISSNPTLADTPMPSTPDSPGRITGIGGIFIKSKDPKALAAWYRDVLGLHLESWGGALLRYDAPQHPPAVVWNAFPESTDYFGPSKQDFMINYAVDDLDAFLNKLKAKGVTAIKREQNPFGKFAWIHDADGNQVELWQPLSETDSGK